jgi:diadenosine hexaphosphate hydrolase (ATP-forming)
MATKRKVEKDFSCGGLVWDTLANKLLLVQVENLSGKKVWTFPKGHPEKGETDEMAAIREVVEETGWMAQTIKKITDVQYFYTQDGVTFDKTVRWFLMKPLQKQGEFDPEEILACQWATMEQTEEMISYDSDKKLVKKLKALI